MGFEQDLQVRGQSKGEAPSLDGLEKPRLCLSPHFSFVKRTKLDKMTGGSGFPWPWHPYSLHILRKRVTSPQALIYVLSSPPSFLHRPVSSYGLPSMGSHRLGHD